MNDTKEHVHMSDRKVKGWKVVEEERITTRKECEGGDFHAAQKSFGTMPKTKDTIVNKINTVTNRK